MLVVTALSVIGIALLWSLAPLGSVLVDVPPLRDDTPAAVASVAALDVEAFRTPIWVAPSAPPATEDSATAEPAHEPPYFMTPPQSPARPVWHWAAGSFIVALGLGFVLGWQMLDRRIRRKEPHAQQTPA